MDQDQRLFEATTPTRPDELLIIAVLIALLLLIGLVGLFWSTWNRIVLMPTSTPTVTRSLPPTITPDLPATQIAIALAAQTSTANAILADVTSTAAAFDAENTRRAEPRPTTATVTAVPEITISPDNSLLTASPGEDSVRQEGAGVSRNDQSTEILIPYVPIITNDTDTRDVNLLAAELTSTAEAAAIAAATATTSPTFSAASTSTIVVSLTSMAVHVPLIVNEPSVNRQPDTPTALSPAGALDDTPTTVPLPPVQGNETATPLPTDTSLPLETPTFTPSPTPSPTLTPFIQQRLFGRVRENGAVMRQGPSTITSGVANLSTNELVTMVGRNATGEWVYLCCPNNQSGWIRQIDARPRDNVLDGGAPDDADPNDVRWLKVEPLPPNLTPLPPQTFPVLPGVFPLIRYDNANQGFIQSLPLETLTSNWGIRERAGDAFESPVIINQNSVLASSKDGHLYSFSFEVGDELWRYRYNDSEVRQVLRAAIVRDSRIYAVDETGDVYALEDQGTSAVLRWQTKLSIDNRPLQPATELTLLDNFLFVGARNGNDHYLVSLDRGNGAILFVESMDATEMTYPAIGGQLVFVGTNRGVTAIDVVNGATIWEATDEMSDMSAPPVYVAPGNDELAELYVARSNGDIIALDPNLGEVFWRHEGDDTVTSMAVDDLSIYASGSGFIKAISREDHNLQWRSATDGNVPGGPLINNDVILLVTINGTIRYMAKNGTILSERSVGIQLTNSYAVNQEYLFVPVPGNTLRAFKGQ